MAMVCRAVLAAAFLAGVAGPVAAATIAIAWDPTPEPRLSGYRVYVGTAPGVHTESFDVGSFQTSFYYTKAVSGQRYYFAVATLIPGATSGKSLEVTGVAAALTSSGDTMVLASRSSRALSSLDQPSGTANANPLERPAAVAQIGSGLPKITSMISLPAGGGLLVLDGVRVQSFSERVGELAYQSSAGTRIAAVAVDPQFMTTGFVYTAEARQEADGEALSVVRHRMLAGALGESAAVVSAGRQPTETAVGLAIAAHGEVVLAQGQRVTVFGQEGSILRSQPMALGAMTSLNSRLAWDSRLGGVWSVGFDAVSGPVASFVSVKDGAVTNRSIVQPGDGGAVAGGVAVVDGVAAVAVANGTTVFRFDVQASRLSPGTAIAEFGTAVSLLPIGAAEDLVVVRETPSGNGRPSYSLLHVRHAGIQ